ncbi:hypothetical protein K502DRAFT_279848, partial [Neoconidiobolus thromboides FSU 785]
ISKQIQILPSKTKPKKISIWGQNGKQYSYLLKGSEDLNVDRLIMQFFKMSQLILNKNYNTYLILPFNKEGGLIEWMDNTIPL